LGNLTLQPGNPAVCTENLNPDVVVMKAAKDRAAIETGRDRRLRESLSGGIWGSEFLNGGMRLTEETKAGLNTLCRCPCLDLINDNHVHLQYQLLPTDVTVFTDRRV